MTVFPIGSKLRFIILDYRDVTGLNSVNIPGYLSSNEIETHRLKSRFLVVYQTLTIPDDLYRELLWPSHISLPPLEDTKDGESNASETVSPIGTALPRQFGQFVDYVHDPWRMLCGSCLGGVLRSKFWSWWEVHRKLPPVNAPDQPDCWYGLDCRTQRQASHAGKYNVSGLLMSSIRQPY